MARVRDLVRAHYESRSLSSGTLDRLRRLAEVDAPAARSRPRILSATLVTTVVVAFAVGLVAHLSAERIFRPAGPSLAERIAREIAMHHVKDLAPDFLADDFASLRESMEKLDFLLHAPARPELSALVVRGGRYCSIQGRLTAQLSLEDSEGRRHTLYETALDDALRLLPEREIEVDGTRVRLWQEAGLLLGIAGPPSESAPRP